MARVLVVDDEEDIREALTEILEDEGHDVYEAENGSEVMAMAVSARIELILLDMAIAPVDRDRVSFYEYGGVKPRTAGAVNDLAAHDLDVNQCTVPLTRR